MQDMQRIHHGSPPPKKFKQSTLAGKTNSSVFLDCEGVVMVDYLQRAETSTGQRYAVQLRELK